MIRATPRVRRNARVMVSPKRRSKSRGQTGVCKLEDDLSYPTPHKALPFNQWEPLSNRNESQQCMGHIQRDAATCVFMPGIASAGAGPYPGGNGVTVRWRPKPRDIGRD